MISKANSFLEFAFFTVLYSSLQSHCPVFYFLLGFCGAAATYNQHVPADGGPWFCVGDFSLDSCAATASVSEGKVNRFAAQIVFVKEGLHGEGHFVPPDRADDDDFVILRHVLNALQELWLYIVPLFALCCVEDFFVVAGIVVARVDFKEVCAFSKRIGDRHGDELGVSVVPSVFDGHAGSACRVQWGNHFFRCATPAKIHNQNFLVF